MREYVSVVLSHLVCGDLGWQPQEYDGLRSYIIVLSASVKAFYCNSFTLPL